MGSEHEDKREAIETVRAKHGISISVRKLMNRLNHVINKQPQEKVLVAKLRKSVDWEMHDSMWLCFFYSSILLLTSRCCSGTTQEITQSDGRCYSEL